MNISEVNNGFKFLTLIKEFFIKTALIKALQNRIAVIEGGYVEPKEGKELDFVKLINQTLLNAGFTSKELEGESWNKNI